MGTQSMEIDSTWREVYGPGRGEFWYAGKGISKRGTVCETNIFADSEEEAQVLGQGLAIARDQHMNERARYVATRRDYEDMFR